MIKNSFAREIQIPGTLRTGINNAEVKKIQAWLTLYSLKNTQAGTATGIDGKYGTATAQAVKNYQKAIGVTADGVVTPALFDKLCEPMKKSFPQTVPGISLREKIINAAELHVKANARELTIANQSNSGPWVRAYMDGNDGDEWLWCMGFVQTVLDQACSSHNMRFTDIVKRSFSCDTVAAYAKAKGNFVKYTAVRANPNAAEKGDIFLLQSSSNNLDWIHTGIISNVFSNGVFETIEGNTNDGGSRNGYAVVKRTRNFLTSKMDIVKITLPT